MIPPKHAAAPLGFPDLSLSAGYADGLRYAQLRLQMFAHGSLKPFCEQHKLPYPTIVNLKNNKLHQDQPRLLQRLLHSLAVPTDLIRHGNNQHFLFPSREALLLFREQLASLEGPTSPP